MTNSKDDQPSSQDPEPIQGEHCAGVEDPEANIANESQIVAESDSSISTHDNQIFLLFLLNI